MNKKYLISLIASIIITVIGYIDYFKNSTASNIMLYGGVLLSLYLGYLLLFKKR